MGDSTPWIDTEPATWVQNTTKSHSDGQIRGTASSIVAPPLPSDSADDLISHGLFAKLVPQNRSAREAFTLLAQSSDGSYRHHRQFIRVDSRTGIDPSERKDCFIFSLGLLPEFPSLGWRLGRGRNRGSNRAVDILLPEGDGVAGVHGRFCWIRGSGGFFIVADNLRGQAVLLNGERLQQSQRLIPFRNQIAFGECLLSVQFETRSPQQEEQFQVELSAFYSRVLQDAAPFVLPTPSEFETRVGNWIVRNPISSGSFGRVSVVTHAQTGTPAAMKELWKTPRNSISVNREVNMAEMLKELKHIRLGAPFEIYHKPVFDKSEKARIISRLDETWRPGPNDAIDHYALFSPLSTGTFFSLIRSRASRFVRTRLFTQVLEGLAFLHQNGIAHRDIKPGNITVKSYEPPDAQIIDFGCATFQPKILYDRPGTIPYLAPEQVDGEYHGRSVDYWAVALVGIELMGYEMPGVRVTAEIYGKMHKWLKDEPKPLDAIGECCKGMLQLQPGDRLTAAKALQGCLSPFTDSSNDVGKRPLDTLDRVAKKRTSSDFRQVPHH